MVGATPMFICSKAAIGRRCRNHEQRDPPVCGDTAVPFRKKRWLDYYFDCASREAE